MLRGAARGAQRRVAVVGWVHGPGGGGGLARAWVVGRSARTIQLYRDGVRPLTDRLGPGPMRLTWPPAQTTSLTSGPIVRI
jgi:hypothetical protein